MKTLRLTIIALFICAIATAQGRFKEKMEQVKSLKVAFITSELNLTADESAKFWPVYNAFDEKQRELRREKGGAYLDRKNDEAFDKMSEKEAAALLTQMEENEEELHQLRKKFVTNLKSILPALKIIKLKKAEDDFNRKLLKQYREKRKK